MTVIQAGGTEFAVANSIPPDEIKSRPQALPAQKARLPCLTPKSTAPCFFILKSARPKQARL
jgi:hypothetical protein